MIDKNKKYRTRDGREVRIYATDGAGPYPVQGACLDGIGWVIEKWTVDGSATWNGTTGKSDLIEVKPRIQREVWVNIFPEASHVYHSRSAADLSAFDSRLACVKITIDCEEGEGL